MPTAKELLSFNFNPSALCGEAGSIIPVHINKIVEVRVDKLKSITERLGESIFPKINTSTIKEVSKKFKRLHNNRSQLTSNFNRRELRTLSHALSYREDKLDAIINLQKELEVALELLDKNWRDSYLFGLLYCYLTSWESKNKSSFEALAGFIYYKLNDYEGNRKALTSLKSNVKYFDKQRGDIDLGYTLAVLKVPILNAATFLGLPESWFSCSFFTKVILSYFEKNRSNLDTVIDELFRAMEQHSNNTKGTKANKLITSNIIVLCNEVHYEHLQDKVKDFAFRLVGDPGVASNWAPYQNALDTEKEILKEGRNILNEWVTKQFINVFFDKCINDIRRKRFWLQYAKKINSFKVYGPKHVRDLLKSDERIAEYVHARFQTVSSNRNTSAFLFMLGDYKMIEFSDPGYAFYAYKRSNTYAPSFDSKAYQSVDLFRNGSMPMLVYRTGYEMNHFSDEGRLSHNDGDLMWETVFNEWIRRKVGVHV
ncbi:EH signature domain-containing protein [Pontibacter akesuensis]|uniref:EH_Signature domain-containing protein n=1 Tax=Pontibacter akesuensis TaxID=388950 RepID=A0A1I7JXU6_9BACT|nr:EH signature domain-containing protein [Pontibacter akesuensis]GHA76721.1 hypothetical protein GCM10007389_33390 [Pontibacter akesuensis]SFU89982.1 EH_Signature domain-containing protein [Pontibacter akesuensis]